MSYTPTLTDEIKGRLQVLGMNEPDIEECVPYVIQTLNQEGSLFRKWYSPDYWQRSVLEINNDDRKIIINSDVLPEVIRWLANHKNTLEATLEKFHQEIHHLSRPAPNEQGKVEE